jgi:methyltransferase (TIGR00027 family)
VAKDSNAPAEASASYVATAIVRCGAAVRGSNRAARGAGGDTDQGGRSVPDGLNQPATSPLKDQPEVREAAGDSVAIVPAVAESPRSPSRTAVLTAVVRARYREERPPVMFDDALAAGLAGEEGLVLSERLRTELPRSQVLAFCRWVCIRSRFTEDLVEQAVAAGVDQYVILGAGLDSFAYRRPDLLERVRVFEVDHPASQSWKRSRLDELGVTIPGNVVFTPVDFEHQTLREGLEETGFEFGRIAVFSWIGVTMYLTLDAINATLATIAQCRPGTQIALTYNQPRHALDDFALQVTSAFSAIAAEVGEPFVSLFVPDEIDELLQTHRFGNIVHFGTREARVAYFDARDDVEIAGAQQLANSNRHATRLIRRQTWARRMASDARPDARRSHDRFRYPAALRLHDRNGEWLSRRADAPENCL